jgi:ELWxxDGT repeat protein
MKKLYIFVFTSFLSIVISISLNAQNFHLVKDINNSKDAYPSPSVTLDGISYFIADDGIHGSELWGSDRTLAGTNLIKDIYPGSASSGIYGLTVSNNKLFFAATDGNGYELWVCNGTATGSEIVPGPTGVTSLTDINGSLYFFDYSGNLWKSDGTAAGTAIVATLTNAFEFSDHLTNLNGVLFFIALDFTYGVELFRTDGTTAGTYLVKDINTSGDSYPSQLTVVNSKLYFSADDGSGRKLWISDGSLDGTTLASNDNAVTIEDTYQPITHIGGILYFSGNTATTGTELYKYNTSTPGITLLKDIITGSGSSNPKNIIDVNESLFFSATGQDGNIGLWKSGGTEAETVLVKNSNAHTDYFANFITINSELYFSYYNKANGIELWESNGTEGGTQLVKDINPGKGSSIPSYLTFGSSEILFSANDGTTGIELWKSDGTEEGTQLIKDINQTTTSSSYPSYLVDFKNNLVFNAFENQHGAELWKSDGTRTGTSLIKDIIPGYFGSNPFSITRQKNNLFFFTSIDSLKLWKMNVTDKTITLVRTFFANRFLEDYFFGTHPTDNQLYFFLINNNTQNIELWRSDGTAQGTYLLKDDFSPVVMGTYAAAVVGNNIFIANLTDTSAALWKSDGTVGGTILVKAFQRGGFYEIAYLYPFKEEVFFSADDGKGTRLWKSDGTKVGTIVVKNLFRPGIYGHAVSNGTLFFDADNGTGRQLWKTDGTTKGTKLVKQIGSYDASPQNLTDVNGTLYFTANDYDYNTGAGIGNELYKTDGTKAGTQLVKDITPGAGSTNFPFDKDFVNSNGELYFTIFDQSYTNLNLWKSNGTETGTKAVEDNSLTNVTRVNNLTPVGPQLFFTGLSYQYGYELYAGITRFAPTETIADNISVSPNNLFETKLLTNPVKDQLKFTVTVKNQEAARVIILDASGRIFTSDKQTLSPGTNMFSYDAKAWTHGMYLIRIVTADGSSSLLKAVK